MKEIIDQLNQFYKQQLESFGPTPEGVNWKNQEAQFIRYEQLIKILPLQDFSIIDLGCGYGNFVEFLRHKGFIPDWYTGYDLSPEMIELAQQTYSKWNNVKFQLINHSKEILEADYAITSGIFSKKLHLNEAQWLSYILETLDILHQKTVKGFSFNMLTKYSDADKMRPDLYYADPCFIFDFCKRNFSKNIALLHDYYTYDFTILVRK